MADIEKIKITDIIPSDYNPRIMPENESTKLRNSLETFGLVDPIVINLKNNHIIGGHQRFDVLIDQHLEDNKIFEELNLIKLGDIGWVFTNTDLKIESEDYEKALNLALNKISGDWDIGKLDNIFNDFELNGFDLTLTGFATDNLQPFTQQTETEKSFINDFKYATDDKPVDLTEDDLDIEEPSTVNETINNDEIENEDFIICPHCNKKINI